MFLVWLSALVFVGAAEILEVERTRNRVEILDERVKPDGSSTATLIYGRRSFARLGPFPLGLYPIASLCGVTFAISVTTWIVFRRRAMANRPHRAG
jgi:hypothetical protein